MNIDKHYKTREETTALTKAKAMLKFRENFQKRLEQRERAAGRYYYWYLIVNHAIMM